MPQPAYRVIVIGGGHAGAEAAWAAANMLRDEGDKVALVTLRLDRVGVMSCNPAIGGLAKGQMVREIDALGGLMGLAADATGIQFKVLNASKGPAVRGPRCQCDKYRYAAEVQRLLRTRDNLDLIEAPVEDLLVEHGQCVGVILPDRTLRADAVVLTTGTFMRGLMHTGPKQTEGGRVGEGPSVGISASLRRLGFDLGRLKTGTPPRLAAESIDFASLQRMPGDETPAPFSDMTPKPRDGHPWALLPQLDCWVTHTHEAIHEQIRANLDRAPLFNGQITPGCVGPRYCPSIEDKVVRFADKTSHHVFLEPESLDTNEIYCNGISTSLPTDIQDYMVHHLPGCERAKILRYGYAVEYDMVRPHQIDATTMTKRIEGLFLAGQINGTSGYEEAAGQGLLAGINAVRYLRGESLVRLGREQAYIGVLMDDLVTKTPVEPYRMFTSRAEHRLVLRADNADQRLTELGREWGTVDDARWAVYQDKQRTIRRIHEHLDAQRLRKWIAGPQVGVPELRRQLAGAGITADDSLLIRVLADAQYAGYIDRHQRQIERLRAAESQPLPTNHDYAAIPGLRTEAMLQLNRFQPATLGQAGRLEGVNPADLMIISLAMSRRSA
ncbi:MAG: tRNA uridine-5-carboxymethylaminomethyl(34) synthesis enzyme MnmG [Phycisphaeraceae bacterium]|nr:tRNA uridine-5-carboxymethylaminomethyl(34) synthesis enzyme MnmG [Phycisphaeraceae bacterium]